MRETSGRDSVFGKVAEIGSRTATLQKKYSPRRFSYGYIRFFSASSQKSHMSLVSGKTVGSAPQGHSFTKML